MALQPPQTPWVGLPKFQDESLLLNAQPIFDVSLGDESDVGSFDTPVPTRIRSNSNIDKQNLELDLSLDLGDYLPEEENQTQPEVSNITQPISPIVTENNPAQDEVVEIGQQTKQPAGQTHKRQGSHSLIPIAGPSKRTKPPVQNKNDDLYSRRLSDSIRRSSSSNLQDLYAMQTKSSVSHNAQASSSKLPQPTRSTIIPKETASSRLKAGLHNDVNRGKKDKREIEDLDVNGHIQKQTTSKIICEDQPSSALSRYLTKSKVNIPTHQSLSDTAQNPQLSETHSENSNLTVKDNIHNQENERLVLPRHKSPFSASSVMSETSSINTQVSKISNINDENEKSTSRRSSMSEKVVGFLSNLLNRSISSNSLKQDAIEQEEEGSNLVVQRDQDNTVTMDSEEHENHIQDEDEVDTSSQNRYSFPTEQSIQKLPLNSTSRINNETVIRKSHGPIVVPLTKPIPFSRPLHLRTEPKNTKSQTVQHVNSGAFNHARRLPLQPSKSINKPTKAQSSTLCPSNTKSSTISTSTDKNVSRPIVKVKTSAFVSAAIAKLPPPGKGHLTSTSNQPITVQSNERVNNLKDRKSVFERLSESSSTTSTSNNLVNSGLNENGNTDIIKQNNQNKKNNQNLTIPIRGHTPGKASNLRLQQRAKFDAIVQEKIKEKEELQRKEQERKEKQEEEEYQRRRKQTVIWAKPVPEMYYKK
ncbi:uncharacterized protein L201_006587 [Kwoniella dendrophila CBS 6074]|uniref:TPX2 C-terminal domain-containing protein n=1 Tax=Kwoniella dendrophila CBS 6074 TaxID=1295534 RepID=A0AAX4K247_9TREE